MPIPSVVIEPASSNEGDDDRDGDIASPIASSGNGVIPECQTTKDASGMPRGFLFKVTRQQQNTDKEPILYRFIHASCFPAGGNNA